MPAEFENKLFSLGIELPTPPTFSATYVPFLIENRMLYISGQLPILNGSLLYAGKVGKDISMEKAQEAAYLCALNILAHLKIACDESFERVKRCVRLGGFINAIDDFSDHPLVLDGASELMIQTFGSMGNHTRTSIGVSSLPLNAPVEIDAIFSLEDEEAAPFSL